MMEKVWSKTRCVAAFLFWAATATNAVAYDFNWGPTLSITGLSSTYSIPGLGFTSPVQNQGEYGICWDFAAIGSLEARYKLTRNDPNYSMVLSESQYPAYDNYWSGGDPTWTMGYSTSHPIVQLSQLPFTPYGVNPTPGTWPLQTGWQNQGVLASGYVGGSTAVANVKSMLQQYGPVVMSVDADTDFYWPGGTVPTSEGGINHDIVVVGWHDATSADAPQIQTDGGYWIIKNQWGTGWGSYGGYSFIPYGFGGSIDAYTGPAYYTGALATATWQGTGGVWASGSNNWTSGGIAYSWVNQETAAVFSGSANNSISISGTAIAHSLTFNPGATGYVFSGGSLTITAGGIMANESVTFNSGVSIGAPQTWTTVAGKSLMVNGNVNTILSNLTVAGAGATTIHGIIGNGAAVTGIGGSLTMQGPGSLTLTASNVYSGATAVSGGLLWLSGSGAIGGTSSLSLVGGTLLLDNSAFNSSARIPSSIGVTLGGGELSLTGNTAGSSQTIGNLSLQQGFGTITVTPTSKPAKWTTGTFSRGLGATALLRGPSLGSGGSGAVGQILFSNNPTLTNNGTGTSTGIVPYFFGDNSSTGSGTDLVTYVSGYGAMLLSSSQYSSSVAAGTNVKLGSSPAAISSTSIQALVITNSGSTTQLAVNSGNALTLTSGALLSTGSSANMISGGSLTVGTNSATSYQGEIYTASNLTIGSAITNNGSNAVSITKSGPATLTYTGANTYTGGTMIVGGTLQVASGGSLISSGTVTVGGGDMPALNVSGGTVSSSNSGNAFYLGNVAGQTGVVNVSAGNVMATSSTGTILLGDYGTGIWNQTGGTTTAANQFAEANQMGSSGQLNVSGGYLSAANSILVAQRGAGSLTLSGSGFVSTPYLAMVGWNYSPATAALNLNGGTLSVGGVYETASGQVAQGQATVNFNGGLLQATGANATFMQGLDYAYVQNGGALIDTQGYNVTVGEALLSYAGTSTGGLTKYGAGTLTLLASNTYTGLTTVNGGLQLGDGSANTGSVAGNVALVNAATLTFANPTTLSYVASISGVGNLVKTGPGLLTLSGTNTYQGTTSINAGELDFSTSSSAPTPPSLPDISIAPGAVLAASGPYTTVTAWLGSGRIAPTSSGAVSLTGSSNLAINLSTGSYSGLYIGSIGTNTYTGTITPAGSTYYLGGAGGILVMPSNGALVDGTSGERNVVVGGGVALAGSNSYSGGTTIEPLGRLNINNAAAIGSGALTIAGGTLGNSASGSVTLTTNNLQYWNGDFAYSGPSNFNMGSGSVTMNGSRSLTMGAGSLTVAGPISGVGASLTVAGTGTLILTGNNTFSGPLNLNGGVLNFAASSNLGTSSLVNFNGGTLQYAASNNYTMAGQTLNFGAGGGSIDPGPNSIVNLAGTLSGSGTLYKLGANAISYTGTSSAMSGTISLAGGSFTVASGGSITGLGTVTQNFQTNATWNVNGTLGTTTVNLAPGSNASYQSSTGVLNINAGGNMTATTMNLASVNQFVGGAYATVNVNSGGTLTATNINMSYVNYGYQTASGTINVNGVLNVSDLEGIAPGTAYDSSIRRYINVNSGGELNATTIDLSQSGGGTYTRQLNLNGGTLANLSGTNLTVDSSTTVTLAGSSTLLVVSPTNSITFSGPISGTGGLKIAGNGEYLLMGSNTYTGATSISAGTLQIGNSSTGTHLSSSSVSLGNSTALIFSPADSPTYSGAISGLGSVIKAGTGIETLTGSNSFTGGATISSGTLALRSSSTLGSGNITVAPGALLDVSANSSGYNFSGGLLTAGRAANFATDIKGSLNVNLSTINVAGGNQGTMTLSGSMALSNGTLSYNAGDEIALGGALAFSGTDYVTPQNWLNNGTFTLFTYNGGSPNVADLVLSGSYASNPRQSYSFVASGGTAVTLVVTGAPAGLLWTGGTNSVWDTATSPSWYNLGTSAASTFYAADNVLFNDTAGTNNNVSISGTVLPGSLTVSNTSVNFTFEGGSIVGNSSLVKTGPGTLTLAASNAFTGGTSLGGGLLNLGNSAALGSGSLVISSGSLDNTSGTAMTLANNIPLGLNGSFTFLGSNPLNVGSGAVALSTSSTITINAAALTVGGPISGTGSLTKAGTGMLVLAGSGSYSGGTTLSSGSLMLNANQALGLGPLTITGGTLGNSSGSAITLANNAQNWNSNITFIGPGSVNLGSGAVAMSSSRTVTVSAGTLTVGGPISGVGDSLTVTGTGTLALGGSNSFSGPVNINSGVLNFANGYSLGTGTAVNFSGGTLQYAAGNPSTVAGETFNISSSGATIDPGSNSAVSLAATLSGAGQLNKLGTGLLTYSGTSTAMTGTISLSGGTFAVASGAKITGLATATQAQALAHSSSSATWNVNGTLAATTANLAPGAGSYATSTGIVNINSGGSMTATTMNLAQISGFVGNAYGTVNVNSGGTLSATTINMAYVGYGYETSNATINVSGILNVSNLQGFSTTGYDSKAQRYINVNAGGELFATTINLSQSGAYSGHTNSYVRQLNLNGGTLGNIVGTNLTVDSTTIISLSGANTFLGTSSSNSSTISAAIGGTGALAMAGVGTFVLSSGSNTYSGGTTIGGGTLSYGIANALPFSGSINVNGGDLNVSTYGGVVGAVTLTSGTIAGTTGLLVGSSYGVQSGLISATLGGAGATLTKSTTGSVLLSAANSYGGGTTIAAGLLTPVNAAALSSGPLTISGGTLNSSATNFNIGSLTMTTSGAALDLAVGNLFASAGTASLAGTINVSGSVNAATVGQYVLLTAASGNISGSFVAGSLPDATDYYLNIAGGSLDLQHKAALSGITASPLATSIITGGTTSVQFTIQNSAPINSSVLNYSASAGTNMVGSSSGSIAASASGSATGLVFSGTTVGSETGSFTVSGGSLATGGTQSGSVVVNVYNHALPNYTAATLNLGDIHAGYAGPITSNSFTVTNGTAGDFRVALQGSAAYGTSGVTLSSFGNLATGATASVYATLPIGVAAGTVLNQNIAYTFGDASALPGAVANLQTPSLNVTGYVYSGVATWTATGSGSWGTSAGNFGTNWVGGSPGLDPNFQSKDTATFGAGVSSGTASIYLNGVSPSLAALTLSNTSASYLIAQGSGGTLCLSAGTNGAPVSVTGNQFITAPIVFNSTAVVTATSATDSLSISGNLSGAGGLNLSGSGVLNLSSTNNSFSGPTTINSGTLLAGANALSPNSSVTINGGLLDATAGPQTSASLTVGSLGGLKLNIDNLLTSVGADTFFGSLIETGSTSLSSVELMSYGSFSGSFSTTNLPSGYTLLYKPNELDLVLAGPPTMNCSGSGSWNNCGNWSTGTSPSGQGAMAVLGSSSLSPAPSVVIVSLDSAQTLGTLEFSSTTCYTLTPGTAGSLMLSNTGGLASEIMVMGGSQSILASVTLSGSNTTISLTGGSLNIAGNILDGDGGKASLLLSSSDGTGLLTLSGTNSFGGGATVASGRLMLEGAPSLLAGSSLTIGGGGAPGAAFSAPAALQSPVAAPQLAPVPEPGTLALLITGFVVVVVANRRRS